ncbi:hypothetical protein [uncultured Jannaschia sp.]|uniref:hypothetical protein n=1 Tax=uncultured Jannaschia sp. TaxID=293347 RepID=UPI002609650B|nr:hypothetical protein [uncultured Jannaschia sp.]
MKAIVHIGMPKCGSTTIQNWLNENAGALAERGIAYDNASMPGYPTTIAHQGIRISQSDLLGKLVENPTIRRTHKIFSLEDQRRFARKFSDYFGNLVGRRQEETFVVSSEYLGANTRTPDGVRALESWLGRYFDDIRYVVYFRRQEDWLASSYSERIKRGIKQTLPEMIEANAKQNWFRKAAIWGNVVGDDRVDARLMEPDFLIGGDLLEDFSDRIGTTAEGLAVPPRQNESLTAAGAEFLRVVNTRIEHTVDDGRKVNPQKVAIRRVLLQQTLKLPKIRLDAEQVAHVREVNAASNEKLRERFFPERAELFPPKPAPDANGPSLRAEDVATVALDVMLSLQSEESLPEAQNA